MNASVQLPVIKINNRSIKSGMDDLAVEEPLEIRLAYGHGSAPQTKSLAVTMRTPGNDEDLAVGFLFTEGVISVHSAIKKVNHIAGACQRDKRNIIEVSLHPEIVPNLSQAERNFYTTSSCGVCGKASIDAIRTVLPSLSQTGDDMALSADIVYSLPQKLFMHQKVFAQTGGLHAASLFDPEGKIISIREDVGRHNALDKLIGAALKSNRIPLSRSILFLSGRASFELVQKAAMARISVIAAVGAPSSLAVSLAMEFGITLVGFLRDKRFNIYSSADRIKTPEYENSH